MSNPSGDIAAVINGLVGFAKERERQTAKNSINKKYPTIQPKYKRQIDENETNVFEKYKKAPPGKEHIFARKQFQNLSNQERNELEKANTYQDLRRQRALRMHPHTSEYNKAQGPAYMRNAIQHFNNVDETERKKLRDYYNRPVIEAGSPTEGRMQKYERGFDPITGAEVVKPFMFDYEKGGGVNINLTNEAENAQRYESKDSINRADEASKLRTDLRNSIDKKKSRLFNLQQQHHYLGPDSGGKFTPFTNEAAQWLRGLFPGIEGIKNVANSADALDVLEKEMALAAKAGTAPGERLTGSTTENELFKFLIPMGRESGRGWKSRKLRMNALEIMIAREEEALRIRNQKGYDRNELDAMVKDGLTKKFDPAIIALKKKDDIYKRIDGFNENTKRDESFLKFYKSLSQEDREWAKRQLMGKKQ